MKPRPTSFAIPIHFNPVTECNILNISHSPAVTNRNISNLQGATKRNNMNMLPVTVCNISDITPATKRNKSDIAPVTVCNISELKRTKPPLMTEHINYKALKMNTTPQPQNTIFETHQKPVTKRNKTEL